MKTSFFDLFKIGIGPSSSHTVGPMRAARLFTEEIAELLEQVVSVKVELYGSLALTGRGHGTDRAILLGLEGELPDEIAPESIDQKLSIIRTSKRLLLAGKRSIEFDEAVHLRFLGDLILPGHSNGMRFSAMNAAGEVIKAKVYYSVGGGFVVPEGGQPLSSTRAIVARPFASGDELVKMANHDGIPIWQLMLENEMAWRTEAEIRAGVARIWQVMRDCTKRGLETGGILAGGLEVRRRAPGLYKRLREQMVSDGLAAMDWLNVWAIAVNEENAAGGRVVTAPTNGAAGIIPSVAHYYSRFTPVADEDGMLRYFLTAAAIGVLYKEHASISGAEVGCQGEVGVACSMAAGGLVAAWNGTTEEVEQAAEIAMEHNLGLTCDPVGGLVQIPCIERNAMGSVKAVNAARIAMTEDGVHKISLDQVIRTMYRTGLDMSTRYKETSQAGLAVSVVEC